MPTVRIRSKKFGHSHAQREDSVKMHRHTGRILCDDRGRDLSDTTARQGTPRIAGHHQKLEKVRKDSTWSLRKSMALPTPEFWTSSLQN